jgi:hypothetical protein
MNGILANVDPRAESARTLKGLGKCAGSAKGSASTIAILGLAFLILVGMGCAQGIVAWGYNGAGQCNVPALPAGLTYVEIAAGASHTVAGLSDGSVVAWGPNYQGQCNVPALPPGLTYVEISAGGNHTVARTAPPIAYPDTNEDLTLLTAINADPLSGGIGNDIKTVVAGNTVTIEVVSPAGTFNSMQFLLIAQGFTTGAPPASAFPNIWMSYPGLTFSIGTYPYGPAGPILPPGGAFAWLNVPPGLSGSSGIFQGVVIAIGSAANGFYAATDAHEIRVL